MSSGKTHGANQVVDSLCLNQRNATSKLLATNYSMPVLEITLKLHSGDFNEFTNNWTVTIVD